MRVALVASSFLPAPGRLERRVDQMARGLARRGAEVEILTQGRTLSTLEYCDGVTLRRFPTAVGPLRFAVSPKLWEQLRLTSGAFDVVDVHARSVSLALAAARNRVRRVVFTPGTPIDVFLSWPHTQATRALIASTTEIVCRSEFDRSRLCQTFPAAAPRTHVVPDGVDTEGLRAARPFATGGMVVLAVDRLNRTTGVARAIAAMLSLGPEFRLVVVGDGPERYRLVAYAGDLRISSRVHFVGAVSDAVLYRWLRTARVVVTLAGERGSGSQVTEACAAGASVVASDLPIHRRAAERSGGGHVIFVPPRGSPFDVADAIDEAARVSVHPSSQALAPAGPSWDTVIDSTWLLYEQLIGDRLRQRPEPAAMVGPAAGGGAANPADGCWWRSRRRRRGGLHGAQKWQ